MSFGLVESDWANPLRSTQHLSCFADAETEDICVGEPVISPPTMSSRPEWAMPVARRIAELLGLGYDWDKRGSAAVRKDVLAFAAQMLCRIMAPTTPAPSIVPLGHGGVQLLWSNEAGEIEAEIVQPNEVIICYFDSGTGTDQEWRAEADFSRLASLLRHNFA